MTCFSFDLLPLFLHLFRNSSIDILCRSPSISFAFLYLTLLWICSILVSFFPSHSCQHFIFTYFYLIPSSIQLLHLYFFKWVVLALKYFFLIIPVHHDTREYKAIPPFSPIYVIPTNMSSPILFYISIMEPKHLGQYNYKLSSS